MRVYSRFQVHILRVEVQSSKVVPEWPGNRLGAGTGLSKSKYLSR
jgi:hypothetical protein